MHLKYLFFFYYFFFYFTHHCIKVVWSYTLYVLCIKCTYIYSAYAPNCCSLAWNLFRKLIVLLLLWRSFCRLRNIPTIPIQFAYKYCYAIVILSFYQQQFAQIISFINLTLFNALYRILARQVKLLYWIFFFY